jgi:hypothetical protein
MVPPVFQPFESHTCYLVVRPVFSFRFEKHLITQRYHHVTVRNMDQFKAAEDGNLQQLRVLLTTKNVNNVDGDAGHRCNTRHVVERIPVIV